MFHFFEVHILLWLLLLRYIFSLFSSLVCSFWCDFLLNWVRLRDIVNSIKTENAIILTEYYV